MSEKTLTPQSVYHPDNYAAFMRWVWAKLKTTIRLMGKDSQMYQTVINGKPILQKNVDAELTMYDVLTAYVDVNGGGTSLPEEWQNKRPTQAEVLEKLIRNAVIEQEAERLKLTVPQEEARKIAAQQYQVLKDAASREDEVNKDARGYYQSLVDYREARHLTEKQYINESANVYRALMLRGKVKEAFLTDYQGDDPDGAWDAHLSSLIAQADIAYSTAEK